MTTKETPESNLHLRAATRHFKDALILRGVDEETATHAAALHAAWMLDIIDAIHAAAPKPFLVTGPSTPADQ